MMRYLSFALLFLVAACSMPPADPAREVQTDRAYGFVAAGDETGLASIATDSLKANLSGDVLQQMKGYGSVQKPVSAKTVQWQSNFTPQVSAYRIVREYTYPEKVVQFDTLMARGKGGAWQVDAVHINSFTASQIALGRFTITNKSPLHYLILAALVVTPLICLVAVGFAAFRRRWGWMVFCLFGVGQISFNWATGAIQFQALQFAVLGAGFIKGPLITDSWVMFFALPLPAILFWLLGKWRPKPARQPKTAVVSQTVE
ncbi:MAG: hypothetical protein KYX67_11120 [Brevundimonas sp.]|mgnify:CR=1 FL=1|jgi:hypothetical protein|uniref:hypothetical protein n=1 Tax=Brevundimonas sp. TaxID=1871086 RepID=UPI002568794D|nr:hypothetical protein [Brevundimonas sp.]MDK2747862.1 hypothetical protein [Brevundimonas sp.]